jgi:glycosyltransferase involved in cell wall biosynthesis
MKRSIIILTGAHLCHNPCVVHKATALTEAGYTVEILGGWFAAELKQQDLELIAKLHLNFVPVIDLTGEKKARRLLYRMRSKLAGLVHRKLGCENRWQLGYAVSALRLAAARRRADLFIAHSEQALWAVAQLSNSNSSLGIHMEDWFSEDLLPEARRERPLKLLRSLEAKLLREGGNSTCPSQAMSRALALEYNCRAPVVIYNAFRWADRQKLDGQIKDRKDCGVPSIHWFSQTSGYGRGLEDLLAALPYLKYPAELHLRGNPAKGFEEWLHANLPKSWRPRVFIHGLVSNDELLSRIAEHDIGFAGEMKYSRSRDLTVTYKMMHYLLAGLAVVASDTSGQREIAQQAKGAVRLYPSGNPQALAAELNILLGSSGKLLTAKAAALAAAQEKFCWERQVPVLVDCIENALNR